jgi:diguanylate cyclase (GGDEF)-like protein/PAS domain S-box-containing protein
MKRSLPNLQPFAQSRAGEDRHLKYKVTFLNSVFLMATLVALGMGFYRWQISPLMGGIDFGFAAGGFVALHYLKHHRDKVELISNIAIASSFLLFLAIYLLAPYNVMRLSLFFLLSAATFYLKGRVVGLRWLYAILSAIVAVHFLTGFQTGYSHIDIFTTCVYLIALFFIFWNYETVKEEQRQREQEYELERQIGERWRLALESAGDAIWDWNLQTHHLLYSRSYTEMLGYSEEELGHDSSVIERLMHPDDKFAARHRLSATLKGMSNGRFVSEARLRCKDGSYRWILCRGQIREYDAQGRALRMVGTSIDTTERKLAEQELQVSRQALDRERRLFQSILDNAPLGVWMLGGDGRLRFVNRSFCRATGITEERFLSANHYVELLPSASAASCMKSDAECLVQDEPHLSMEWLPFMDGRDHLLEITKVRLLNRDGSVSGLIGLAMDVTERNEHEKQLERIAHYDSLTGVPNRVLLADRLAQALARTKREKGLMAVCYLDLDGFKPVNDTFGHEVGDHVLVEITRRIKEVIREDDTVARLGGDEFVVLLVGLEMPEECAGSLNRLLDKINQPIDILGKQLHISASIGVSLYPEDEQDADTLLRHADQAMYIAKQSGRNRYHLFDATNDLRARSHHELLQQIRHGLRHDEFELYYQPKVEMASGRLVGAEALIRWHHPTRGFLLPVEFLHVIENTELEIELGDWVFAHAFQQLRRWRQAGQTFEVSINASAYHLQSAAFVPKLQALMDGCCNQPCHRCVQIEVLETAALDDIAHVSTIIRSCRAFGVGFALDDFGTGYSSLTYLSNLDVDTLKIDQSFVRGMLVDKGDQAIVQGIVALAKAFERGIVAEGVESDEHYRALLQLGCEVGQGFGIARPMPAADLIEWSEAWSPSKVVLGQA